MKRYSKLGLVLGLVYLAIFVLTELIAFYGLIFETASSDLSGVLALFVTLPWSIALVRFWDAVGFIKWYGQFAGRPALYGFFGLLAILPGAILNAAIVYYIGKAIGRIGTTTTRGQAAAN